MLRPLSSLWRRAYSLSSHTPRPIRALCTQSAAQPVPASAEPSSEASTEPVTNPLPTPTDPNSVAPPTPVIWPVDAPEDGTRLDRFIKRRAPGLPPGLIQRLIRQRRVIVNAAPANRNAYPVHTGDVVRFPGDVKLGLSRRKRAPPPEDVSLAEAAVVRTWVVHRDARCVVLDKPAGLPVQGGSGVGGRHLEALLPGLGAGRYWLVHRLDREVAGAIIVARDVGAAGLLAEYFRSRMVRKTYWGLVQGRPREPAGVIEMKIDDKRAFTSYRTIQTLDRHFTWLELRPRTGRKHQLRIHCAEGLGTPLLGEGRYGGRPVHVEEQGGILAEPGLHLMSREVTFPRLTQHQTGGGMRARKGQDGRSNDMITVTVPLPSHMRYTWKRFGLDEKLA